MTLLTKISNIDKTKINRIVNEQFSILEFDEILDLMVFILPIVTRYHYTYLGMVYRSKEHTYKEASNNIINKDKCLSLN